MAGTLGVTLKGPAGVSRGLAYAVCAWATLFAAPHIWWASGIRFGFPGGDSSYAMFMAATWRVAFNLLVIALSMLTIVIALTLLRPPASVKRRWIPMTAASIGAGLLLLRGVAGMVVDGLTDPIWWPTFLVGGLLLSAMAWSARQ